MRRINFILLFIFVFSLAALTTYSMVIEKATLKEITNESALIVHGKVLDIESKWEGKNIYTYYTVEVNSTLKGKSSSSVIKVKQLGGQVGYVKQTIDGSPILNKNEELVLFLVKRRNNFWIHSIAMGCYRVIETGGIRYAVNKMNDITLVDKKGNTVSALKEEDLQPQYELANLISKVNDLVNKN